MKYCAELGLGSAIAHIAAALSAKKAMCEMFGKSPSRSVASYRVSLCSLLLVTKIISIYVSWSVMAVSKLWMPVKHLN